VKVRFAINLHKRDLSIKLKVKEFFGGIGTITESKTTNSVAFSVEAKKDLINVIIPHFNKYKLLTQKGADFILFQRIIEFMYNKKSHLTKEGLQEIINIRASLNLGLSDLLKINFIKTNPVERPIINTTKIPDPNWVTGFINGKSNFNIMIQKNKKLKIGHIVKIRFRIYQNERDLKLIEL
jgi:LAGLIDADG endonuclease